MATYQMVYGDDDQFVTETFSNIDAVEREDGWLVLFRGREAILRVQESHVRSFERLIALANGVTSSGWLWSRHPPSPRWAATCDDAADCPGWPVLSRYVRVAAAAVR